MPRKVEFDIDEARSSALELFWSQGYSATSMAQLLDAMGIGQSSFYASFGSKRSLFEECLETFYFLTRDMLKRSMRKHGSHRAIAEFFYSTMLRVPSLDRKRGCMLVNSVVELSEVDEELSKSASHYLDEIQSLFEECIVASLEAGHTFTTSNPKELSAALMIANCGLRVASRTNISQRQLADSIHRTLAAMGVVAS